MYSILVGNPGKGGIIEEHRHLNNSYSLAQGSLGLPPYMFFFGGKGISNTNIAQVLSVTDLACGLGRSKDGRELMAKVSTANLRRLSSSSDHNNAGATNP